MQAIHITEFGGPEVLKAVTLDEPVGGPQDLLIEVEASGINYADGYFRQGAFPGLPTPPFIAGMEGVGRIRSAPKSRFKVGQRVAFATHGSYAEQVVIPEAAEAWQIAVAIADDLPLEHAVGLAMSGRTAYLLSRQVGTEHSGAKALVYAAAGGVGWVLCQLLKEKGLKVVALVGDELKKQALAPLHLEAVINRQESAAQEQIAALAPNGYQAIFNAAGGETIAADLDRLAPCGQLVWYGFGAGTDAPNLEAALGRNFMKSVRLMTFNGGIHDRAENIQAVTELVTRLEKKTIIPPPAHAFALAHAAQAHQRMQQADYVGKLFLKM